MREYRSPEPRQGHERRRRMAMGGWQSLERLEEEVKRDYEEEERVEEHSSRLPARRRRGGRERGSDVGRRASLGASGEEPRAHRGEREEYEHGLDPARQSKQERREKELCPEGEGYRGRQEGRKGPGVEVKEKQDQSRQRKGEDKHHMRREGMQGYEAKRHQRDEEAGRKGETGRWDQEHREAEEKDEQVGAEACAAAAADVEEKDEQVEAKACAAAAADAEEKDEQVGAEACAAAAADAEEKDEQVGAWECGPVVAEAEGKDEKMQVRACGPQARKQAQDRKMAEQQVRKLWEAHPELLRELMVKEAMRRTKTDVGSTKAEMACNGGQKEPRGGR
ncbi:unnamed protein product [Closterium sp. Naga37s-1]|nr:unnamed protein product [Closterium sp. Naga37s-1]